jgi:hypothetical protein
MYSPLVQDEGIIEGQEHLKSYITNYYKNLFGALEKGNFHMDETQTDDIPQVLLEENTLLTVVYSQDEVRKAIFQMEHNKAPGPDGFPVEFYQNFWDAIKLDLLAMFSMLHAGQLELYRLNFGEIILLPMVNETKRIEQYGPIFLLNVSSKICTTVPTISLNTIAVHVV